MITTVRDILKVKGNTIWTVSPQDTVFHTLKLMADKNVGAVLVVGDHQVVGIFSERDFARHAIKGPIALEQTPVSAMMTSKVLFINPSQTMDECMSLMTAKHIRHLPVLDNDKLVGLISIGDVVNKTIEDHKFSINQLERYITGNLT